jgi:alpha/beta superfamily hydrolase
MNPRTQRREIPGPAGIIECALDEPAEAPARGLAVFCHPHPLHGGTLENKVVQTLARCAVQRGWRAVRFNFRGVGGSAGHWDAGQGEVDDACTVVQAWRQEGQRLVLGGFSFGAYVASHAAARTLAADHSVDNLFLVGPAVQSFAFASVPSHALVVHGEKDEVVPLPAVFDCTASKPPGHRDSRCRPLFSWPAQPAQADRADALA